MAAVPVAISGLVYDKLARTYRPVLIVGMASIAGLSVGGGPIFPELPLSPFDPVKNWDVKVGWTPEDGWFVALVPSDSHPGFPTPSGEGATVPSSVAQEPAPVAPEPASRPALRREHRQERRHR